MPKWNMGTQTMTNEGSKQIVNKRQQIVNNWANIQKDKSNIRKSNGNTMYSGLFFPSAWAVSKTNIWSAIRSISCCEYSPHFIWQPPCPQQGQDDALNFTLNICSVIQRLVFINFGLRSNIHYAVSRLSLPFGFELWMRNKCKTYRGVKIQTLIIPLLITRLF